MIMKRLLFLLKAMVPFLAAKAGDGDSHITINAGILAPYTLDATIGYEHPLGYSNAVEIYGEGGNHWQKPVCHMFWKGWFWDGGVLFKHRLARFKNGGFRVLGGLHTGMNQQDYFFGVEAGFEYNYVFPNNWVFSVRQKNTVNFLHGDVFRCGVMVGVKIPL